LGTSVVEDRSDWHPAAKRTSAQAKSCKTVLMRISFSLGQGTAAPILRPNVMYPAKPAG
jgi:hypothetical protein